MWNELYAWEFLHCGSHLLHHSAVQLLLLLLRCRATLQRLDVLIAGSRRSQWSPPRLILLMDECWSWSTRRVRRAPSCVSSLKIILILKWHRVSYRIHVMFTTRRFLHSSTRWRELFIRHYQMCGERVFVRFVGLPFLEKNYRNISSKIPFTGYDVFEPDGLISFLCCTVYIRTALTFWSRFTTCCLIRSATCSRTWRGTIGGNWLYHSAQVGGWWSRRWFF